MTLESNEEDAKKKDYRRNRGENYPNGQKKLEGASLKKVAARFWFATTTISRILSKKRMLNISIDQSVKYENEKRMLRVDFAIGCLLIRQIDHRTFSLKTLRSSWIGSIRIEPGN